MNLPIAIDSDIFTYEHLLDNCNHKLVYRFEALHNARGLTNYIKKQAEFDEKNNLARTYIVKKKDSEAIIAYFTLKAASIPFIDEVPETSRNHQNIIPAIELENIALNSVSLSKYKKLPPHIGQYIWETIILPIIKHVSHEIGATIIYLFATCKKVAECYERWGFNFIDDDEFNTIVQKEWQNKYSSDCIFMYMPISKQIQNIE